MQESVATPYVAWLNPGEMAGRVSRLDWRASALGPLTHWPAELRTTVGLCFESILPGCVYWGREAVQIFNQTYAESILGDPTSGSLGRPLATEGPEFRELCKKLDQVFHAGQTIGPDAIAGNGSPSRRPSRLAGSFSPIRDASGEVVGIYQVVGGAAVLKRMGEQPATPSVSPRELPKDRERSFTAFADAIPTLAWMADRDGYLYWYNRRWYEYTGSTPEQMEGWGWQTVHDPKVLPSVMERWTGSIKSGEPFEMVFPLLGADGVFRSFLTRVSPVRNAAGAITQWFGTNTEIDELQRTRDALAASEEELGYTVDLNPQMPWIADAEGRVVNIARRWLEMTGLSHEVAVGSGWRDAQHADDRPHLESAWMQTIGTGVPLDMEHRIRSASGTYRWFRSRAFPRRDDAGRILKWYGTTEDIDDRKNAQAALARSEERLRLALTAVSGIGTFDWNIKEDRLELDAVVSRLFGMEPSQGLTGLPRENFMRAMHPEDRPRVEAAIAHTMASGEVYAADYRVVHQDESIRWISARGSCIFDGDRIPVRFVGVCLDITERKLTEMALIQNEKLAAVGRLAASIAHEINNPLEAAMNLIYLARNGTSPAQILEYLDTAEQELRRVSAISGQTLRFHRQSSKPTLVTCEEMCASVMSIFQGRLHTLGIAVEKRVRCSAVSCFEGEIRQVLSNLIGNAIDAMSPGPGRLLIRGRDGRQWQTGVKGLVLTVADCGPGMSPATARRALEPFFTTKEVAGTGLGLWISKEIVARHNGSLRFRSSQSNEHHGTVFTIFLPFEPAVRT